MYHTFSIIIIEPRLPRFDFQNSKFKMHSIYKKLATYFIFQYYNSTVLILTLLFGGSLFDLRGLEAIV